MFRNDTLPGHVREALADDCASYFTDDTMAQSICDITYNETDDHFHVHANNRVAYSSIDFDEAITVARAIVRAIAPTIN